MGIKRCIVAVSLWFSLPVSGQVYVVSGGAGNGGSWADAMGNLQTAVNTAQGKAVKEVRVKAGEYRLGAELQIPASVTVRGGYKGTTPNECWGDGAQRTVLIGDGSHRVVNLTGTLEGFTVKGGKVQGENGGGVYVQTGGVIKNCIVKENSAGKFYPRVGDVICKNGGFLRREEISAAHADTIKGIIFWINPNPKVWEKPQKAKENRGWAVALAVKGGLTWSKPPVPYVGEVKTTTGEALQDTTGWQRTVVMNDELCPVGKYCKELDWRGITAGVDGRGTWFVPALGQLRQCYNEQKEIITTHEIIRTLTGIKAIISPNANYSSSTDAPDSWVWCVMMGSGEITQQSKTLTRLPVLPVMAF